MIKEQTFFLVIIALVLSIQNGTQARQLSTNSDLDAEVIVIGAGASGIAAATKLDKNGINVKIIEAESRWGGRIHSIKFGDAFVDMGAEWCHGEKGNVVYELVKDMDILTHPNYTYQLYSSDRTEVDESLNDELHTIFEEIYSADSQRNATDDDSIGSYFSRTYLNEIEQRYSNDLKKLEFARLVLHSFKNYVMSSEGALSILHPSAKSDYRECEGDLTLTWNGLGYKTFLEKLMVDFDSANKILINKEVQKITQNGDIVEIKLANDETMKANYVIFTPSLGVLKSKHRELFSPELEANKVTAIENLGIGAVMKVQLHFSEAWWPKDNFSGFTFVWTDEDRKTLYQQFVKGPQKAGMSWLLSFLGAVRAENNPKVLSCLFVGELVPEIEKMDDEDLINGITFALKKLVGHLYKVQKPDKFARTHWFTNPHFQGTYSFQTVASRKMTPSANEILSEPVKNAAGAPKILFAGETTHPYLYSTVQGATESGFREADRLINIIKPSNTV